MSANGGNWVIGEKVSLNRLNNIENRLNNMQVKEVGKGLSTNDFTDVLKDKLENIDATGTGASNQVTGVKGSNEVEYRIGEVEITADNIGLGSVGNFKAVSTVASQGLTDTEKANARANIGAGTSSFSLTDIPTITSTEISAGLPAMGDDGVYPTSAAVVAYINSRNFASGSHVHTKSDIGLGNVNNTSDAAKPISTATQNALNDKVAKVSGKGLSTEDFTTTLKTKLEHIQAPIIDVNYSELKRIRNSGELVPGNQYRIVDYSCTTTQTDTRAQTNSFDIIVVADTTNSLNENARACIKSNSIPNVAISPGTPYFILKTHYDADLPSKYWGYKYYDRYYLTADIIDIAGEGTFYTWAEYTYNIVSNEFLLTDEIVATRTTTPAVNDYVVKFINIGENDEQGIYLDECASDYNNQILWVYSSDVVDTDYFSNSNLGAWELKYCLDNDENRFLWADTVNGKGVIYWMKDEWNNEAPYDFKNIQFKRYLIAPQQGETDLSSVLGDALEICDGYLLYNGSPYASEIYSSSDYIWCYTFSARQVDSLICSDASLTPICGQSASSNGEYSAENMCEHNIIKEYSVARILDDTVAASKVLSLNNITIQSLYTSETCTGGRIVNNYFGPSCSDMSFFSKFTNNTFVATNYDILASVFNSNTIDSSSHNLVFGISCSYNTLSKDCCANIFNYGCYNNTFDTGCANNKLGAGTKYVSFGKSCRNIVVNNSNTIDKITPIKLFGYNNNLLINNINNSTNVTIQAGISGTSDNIKVITVPNQEGNIDYKANNTTTIII